MACARWRTPTEVMKRRKPRMCEAQGGQCGWSKMGERVRIRGEISIVIEERPSGPS